MKSKKLISVVIGALFLMGPAFLNRFPFLYADTGTYMSAGFSHQYSIMRPMFYGFFMRHASLMESFWLVVWVQAMIVSACIHVFFQIFYPESKMGLALWCTGLLSLFTNIGISTGMLMPDFLTPVLILTSGILFFGQNLSKKIRFACGILLLFSLVSHHSHAYILFMGLICFLIVSLLSRSSRQWLRQEWKRGVLVAVLGLIGYSSLPAIHYWLGGRFERENASHVFMMSRIHQYGLLKPFLEQKCAQNQFEICAYKDHLTDNFLWASDSPANQAGGWEARKGEYDALIRDFFSDGYFFKKFAIKTLESSIAQFFTFEGKIVFPEKESGAAVPHFIQHFPDQLHAIRDTLQFQDAWKFESTDLLYRFAVYGSLLCLAFYFWFSGDMMDRQLFQISTWIVLLIYANSFVCGGISMIDPRFQSRVMWLFPMLFFLIWMRKKDENGGKSLGVGFF